MRDTRTSIALRRAAFALACGVALVLPSRPAAAARPVPFAARAGLANAEAAAQVWAQDAALVYVENDADVGEDGGAARWGYLFYSQVRRQARAYSVRDGRVVVAETLPQAFAAPVVASQWIDSAEALRTADAHGGLAWCRAHGGHASTLLLTRGLFDETAPDRTTWTIVYTAPGAPSLFVLVDAAEGRVCRSWRG